MRDPRPETGKEKRENGNCSKLIGLGASRKEATTNGYFYK